MIRLNLWSVKFRFGPCPDFSVRFLVGFSSDPDHRIDQHTSPNWLGFFCPSRAVIVRTPDSGGPMFFLGSQIGVSTVFAQLIRHCGEIEFRDFDQIGTQIGFFGT